MLNAFGDLLGSKLCQHNRPGPKYKSPTSYKILLIAYTNHLMFGRVKQHLVKHWPIPEACLSLA